MSAVHRLLVLIDAKLHFMTTREMLLALAYILFDVVIVSLFVGMLWRAITVDSVLWIFWIPFLTVVIALRVRQIRKQFRLPPPMD